MSGKRGVSGFAAGNKDAALMLKLVRDGVQCLPDINGLDPHQMARRMKHADVWALVIAKLTAAGLPPPNVAGAPAA